MIPVGRSNLVSFAHRTSGIQQRRRSKDMAISKSWYGEDSILPRVGRKRHRTRFGYFYRLEITIQDTQSRKWASRAYEHHCSISIACPNWAVLNIFIKHVSKWATASYSPASCKISRTNVARKKGETSWSQFMPSSATGKQNRHIRISCFADDPSPKFRLCLTNA